MTYEMFREFSAGFQWGKGEFIKYLDENKYTLKEFWDNCDRKEFLFSVIHHLRSLKRIDNKILIKIACECARLSLHYVADGDFTPLKAIRFSENYANGLFNLDKPESDVELAQCGSEAENAAICAAIASKYAKKAASHAANCVNYANIAAVEARDVANVRRSNDENFTGDRDCNKLILSIIRNHITAEMIESCLIGSIDV